MSYPVMEWSIVSKKSLIIGLCAGVLAIAFEAMSVSTAMPAAAADLGQKELYAWVFSLFVIGMMATTVIGGRISDRYGPPEDFDETLTAVEAAMPGLIAYLRTRPAGVTFRE